MAYINDRPLPQKVLLKNTTRMSLHERFTYLRQSGISNTATMIEGVSALHSRSQVVRQRVLQQQQQARSRRLAMQMERRPAVMAALKLKKRSLRQRLGVASGGGTSIKERLTLGVRGRKGGVGGQLHRSPLTQQHQQQSAQRRGRQRGRSRGARTRAPSVGRLSRSQSMQSLNNVRVRARSRSRSRSRSRVRTYSNNSLNNIKLNRIRGRQQRGGRLIRNGGGRIRQQQQRGGSGGRNFRGRSRGNWGMNRGGGGGGGRGGRFNRDRRGGRGRGGFRGGQSRGGRGGRRDNNPLPTKEELDNQLDQYMANSRFSLDKDLDSYMKEATLTAELATTHTGASTGETPMVTESWD